MKITLTCLCSLLLTFCAMSQNKEMKLLHLKKQVENH